ncbi:Melanoma inhibitory activity protein 2 [Vulpes lagopus]
MEGLLPVIRSTFQFIQEHLWGALLVISESCRYVSGLCEFPWEILLYGAVLVLIVKKLHILRSVKALGKRCSVPAEVCGKRRENMGPMTQAGNTLGVPEVKASLSTIQTMCLSAKNTNHCRLSLQNSVDFLKKSQERQSPKLPQVTNDRPILKTSKEKEQLLWKKLMDDLNENTHFLESPELLTQEIMIWKQRLQAKEQEKERLEQSNAQMQQALKDKVNHLIPMHESLLKTIPWPDLLGDHLGHGNSEAENDNHPNHQSEGVNDDADSNVSLQSAEEKKQELARQLWEEKQRNEELTGLITGLQAKEASLQCENSQLESEIQQLKLNLQILPELYQEYIMQLETQSSEKEAQCSEIEKKISNARINIQSTYQIRNLYKEMARNMERELKKNTSFYLKEIFFHANRVQESWMAAVLAEKNFKELKKEDDHNRQMLAKAEANFQPFPTGFLASAIPLAAHTGPEVSGGSLHHQHPQKTEKPGYRGLGIQGHLQV